MRLSGAPHRRSPLASAAALYFAAGAAAAVTVAVPGEQKPFAAEIGLGESRANGNPFTDEFGRLTRGILEEWKVPGMSIAVIDGEDVYAEGYGIATFPDTPATPETLWYGASTSKAQLAATLSHLIDRKDYPQLAQGWRTTISSIIRDDFVLQDEWATNHITLDDAVSHRTGMPRHDMSSFREIDGRPALPGDIVRNLRNLPLENEPRVEWSYCNLMFVTLSYVVETITGDWLGDVLRKTIWGPLGMDATYFSLQDAFDAPQHFAQGYSWSEDKQQYDAIDYMSLSEVTGAGSVISNVLDYAKWVKCLLHEEEPLSAATHKDIRMPRMFVSQANNYTGVTLYSLGWDQTTYNGHMMYTHSGGMHAYGAMVYWFPEIKYGVVSFGNTALTSNAVEEILSFKLIGDKMGLPEEDRANMTEKWTTMLDKLNEAISNPGKSLYPDAPEKPLLPTADPSLLVGSYYNKAYGNFTFRTETAPETDSKAGNGNKAKTVFLVADRPDTTWKYSLVLNHVSGDFWAARFTVKNSPMLTGYAAAEFKIGVDGNVTALELDMRGPLQPKSEGLFVLEKIG